MDNNIPTAHLFNQANFPLFIALHVVNSSMTQTWDAHLAKPNVV